MAAIPSEMTSSEAQPIRIEALESVRGFAALLIVFFHIPGWNPRFFNVQIVQHGYLMVELFFVLSGFVIFHAYGRKLHKWRDIAHFEFLRIGRLYPVHLLFLLFFLAIEFAKYFAANSFNVNIPNSVPFRENNWVAFMQQLLLLQDIGPTGNALTFNIPAWSISVEFYTYLVFAVISVWAPLSKLWVFGSIALASIVLLTLGNTFGFKDLLLCTAGFFLGCLTAAFPMRVRWLKSSFATAFFIAGIIILLQSPSNSTKDLLIYPLTSGLILAIASTTAGPVQRILGLRAFVWLGAISFSLYMSHETVLWFINQVFRMILKRPEIVLGGRSVPQLPIAEAVVAYPVALLAILAVAYLTFRIIEDPFRRRSRKLLGTITSKAG